jgi:uncharacterized circularly permuted ATP-grasp superfamily protein
MRPALQATWPTLVPAGWLDAVAEAGAVYGAAPVCVHAEPLLLGVSELRRWQGRMARFHRLVRVVRQRLLDDLERGGGLAWSIGIPAFDQDLARIDPGFRSAAPLARLDTFPGEDPQFIELNAEAPAGMGYAGALAGVFRGHPGWAALAPRGLRHIDPFPALRRTLLAIHRERGGRTSRPSIAIVDEPGGGTAPELRLLRDRFRAAGHACEVAAPGDLAFDGERLRVADLPVDIVYRRLLVKDLRERPGCARTLLDAYRAGRVCMVNPLRTALLHNKGVFALLHAEDTPMSAADRAFVRRHVPETHVLLGVGAPEAREVARRNPSAWVLKPLDDHGGAGVTLGWTVPPADWERAVDGADRHVLQRRATAVLAPFLDARDGRRHVRLVGLDPFLCQGRLAGFLCRLAGGELANVTSGGATQVPVLIVG